MYRKPEPNFLGAFENLLVQSDAEDTQSKRKKYWPNNNIPLLHISMSTGFLPVPKGASGGSDLGQSQKKGQVGWVCPTASPRGIGAHFSPPCPVFSENVFFPSSYMAAIKVIDK